MARHFVNHHSFGEAPRGMPFSSAARAFDAAGFNSPVGVMLIAIRHDPQPPIFHGQHLLQRLQALLAPPGSQAEFNAPSLPTRPHAQIPPDELDEMPTLPPPRILPPLPLPLPRHDQPGPQPRLVRGDILSDSTGQLYERFGRHVRPLQRVVSGPRGEILELVPGLRTNTAAERHDPNASRHYADSLAGAPPEPPVKSASAASTDSTAAHAEESATVAYQSAPPQPVSPPRGLRPDPRQMRRRYAGDFNPPPAPPPIRPQPPVAEPPPQTCAAQPPPPAQPVPGATVEAAPNATPNATPNGGPKTAIPEQWLKPWELRLSRDEALYDMRLEAAANSSVIGAVHNLKRRLGNGQAFQKWQSLLAGKSLDEQLWGVRPPTGQFAHPQVREWTRQTLALAGYDPGVMLPEWEIFWRRKGL